MNRHRLPTGLMWLVLGLITACSGAGSEKPDLMAFPQTHNQSQSQRIIHVEPQSQALMLRLTSPEKNMVTDSKQITVAGVTSPDATLSVNGRLVSPDGEGLFSTKLDYSDTSIALVIEVIASSITGETKSEIRPVIFSDRAIQSGLFGTVSSANPSNITLDTAASVVSLSVDASTSVTLHDRKSPSISDITAGTLVGVITQDGQAKSILTVPNRPVLTQHFNGVVINLNEPSSSEKGMITLEDSSKRQITAKTSYAIRKDTIGTLVTAVLKQDVASGSLEATAIDPALKSAERISVALSLNQESESRQAEENITSLLWRLKEHGVRNMSMLLDLEPNKSWKDSVISAEKAYTSLFSKHHIGSPSADVTGLVTSIATSLGTSSTKLITVQPMLGQPISLKLPKNTPVSLRGDRIKSGQLDLASHVTVRYSIRGNVANRITVMAGNALKLESSTQLAASAGHGEVQGLLMDVLDLESLVSILVDQETGHQMSLRSEGARIFNKGVPIELDSSLEGSNVLAWFDPDTNQLLEMESLDLSMEESLVSGVIDSLIPKFANNNLTIRTIDGQTRALTHHADTVIRRNGLRVSIHDVLPGDLVRPNTKVLTSNGVEEILFLGLKTPVPGRTSGFIRGITAGPDGDLKLTVSNTWMDLISLKISSRTSISQHGHTVEMQDLAVGQEVNLAIYDPVTLETDSLDLNPTIESDIASK